MEFAEEKQKPAEMSASDGKTAERARTSASGEETSEPAKTSATGKEASELAETSVPPEGNTLCADIAKEIFEETNRERAAAGLPELAWNEELAAAADIRAEEIIDCFSHVRPDGTKCYALGDRIHGENIAKSPLESTGSEFVQHWMDSPGHRENILRERFTMIGVGIRITDMGITAVQIFGY